MKCPCHIYDKEELLMTNITNITCQLYIPQKYYLQLDSNMQELFKSDDLGFYYSGFPADIRDDSYLGEYLIAYCEIALIMGNPKYQLTDECDLQCELLKLGQDENAFNLLVTIHYPGVSESFHAILVFKEREQRPGFYSFELLGDQTMFSTD
jgi:hypothetical protein